MRRELIERLGLILITAIATWLLSCMVAAPPFGMDTRTEQTTDADQITVLAAPDAQVGIQTGPSTVPSQAPP